MKAISAQSLHSEAEKWLSPCSPHSLVVTETGRFGPENRRYVQVASTLDAKAHALYFFSNRDGQWSVLPPTLRHLFDPISFERYGFFAPPVAAASDHVKSAFEDTESHLPGEADQRGEKHV